MATLKECDRCKQHAKEKGSGVVEIHISSTNPPFKYELCAPCRKILREVLTHFMLTVNEAA